MIHRMTLDLPTRDGIAMQHLVLYLDDAMKSGVPKASVPTRGALMSLLRNVRVGSRCATMSLPDSVEALTGLLLETRMLKIGHSAKQDYVVIVERHIERALQESKKSPLQRLADASTG